MSIEEVAADLSRDARAAATEARVEDIARLMLIAGFAAMSEGESLVFIMAALARIAEHILATGQAQGSNQRAARDEFIKCITMMTGGECRPLPQESSL